jgi:26S proteasome regulatory subunit N7
MLSGVIVANRPDKRNGEYQAIIKNGDLLLNKIQRLARVVSL